MTDEPSIVAHVLDLRVALIGYGEVGRIFGQALVSKGVARVTAYDILLDQPSRSAEMRNRATRDGVRLATSAAAAAIQADIIISAVTASAPLDAPQLFIAPRPHPLTQYINLQGVRVAHAKRITLNEHASRMRRVGRE